MGIDRVTTQKGACKVDGKSREWLELHYSPSRWSKRMTADKVVENHVKVCSINSASTKQNLRGELNLSYGANNAKMDIFYPMTEDQDSTPVIVFIHGGYWQEGSKDIYSFISNSWTQAGCIAAVVGYNLAPEVSLDNMVTEIQHAVEFVAKKFPKSKLFLCGHSAGAHLCAMMSLTNWNNNLLVSQAIHGMCLLSGVFDLVPLINTYINDAVSLDVSSASRNSPQRILQQSSPTIRCPTLVVVEEHGSPEFTRQSKEYVENLTTHGVQCSFIESPGVDHFNLIENMVNPEDFLCKEILKLVPGKTFQVQE